MTPIYLPNQPEENKINLETRAGNPIENHQLFSFSPFELNQFQGLKDQYPFAVFKNNHIPFSNCHGYVFASSRTCIIDVECINKILNDDGYTKINDPSKILPGDIIIYWSDEGDAEHSAIVICKPESKPTVPWVVGRWGRYDEVVHLANNCPYDFSKATYHRITK